MQMIDGLPVYSATDLVGFLACEHLTNLERAAMAGLASRPMRPDPELDRIAMRGAEHEKKFLQECREKGLSITEIESAPNGTAAKRLRDAARQTKEAMRTSAELIYQATFFDGRRRGHADFLMRVDTPSNLGGWSYEVWDTKLARTAKGSAVLQLCFYSDLLGSVQGTVPAKMWLALGGSEAQKIPFRVDDYLAYYRLVVRDFEQFLIDGEPAYPPTTRPDPVEHCDVCRWSEVCQNARREADDLSLVAGITSRQRRALRERGIATRTSLGSLSLPIDPPLDGVSSHSLARVTAQVRIQVEGASAGRTISELLNPTRTKDGQFEPNRGLLILPEPSSGDLFFDIEGDPFALDDGVEYLFGVLEPANLDAPGEPTFHCLWAIDDRGEVTRDAERQAFEALIDLIMVRLDADPNLHVYHYAPYEPSAVRRLMGRYGTRETEVDYLLRGSVFVDLFRAVRQGIRASVESYSIKRLEPLDGFKRTIDLRDAGSSIAAFETWLELGGEVEDDPNILGRIEGYNRDDCISAWKLRDWLEEQRTQLSANLGEDLPRPLPHSGEAGEELTEALEETAVLAKQLLHGISDDPEARSPEESARWLLAQLLHWHRREDKSTWWRYFFLMQELSDEDRISESDAMGGLVAEGEVRQEKQSIVYRFRFPPQDHKIAVGSSPRDPATGKSAGTVVSLNDETGTIELRRGKRSNPPEPTSLVPLEHVNADVMEARIHRVGAWVAEHGIDTPGDFRAGRDLLLRRPPRVGQQTGTPLVNPGESAEEAARRLAVNLETSYLAVQGPPGSGKTTLGAETIVDLAESGKRVGVTANSHKVIGQLLEKVAQVAARRGAAVEIAQRADRDGTTAYEDARPLSSNDEAQLALSRREVNVVGGTAWLWSREEMSRSVDVLFIDEAGQMSLANAIAVSGAASSLVLLGDPQQLDQPLQGVHPLGADRSVLAHVLDVHDTMPADIGLFLADTWLLHPDICAYTSETFYESRLSARAGCERQKIVGPKPVSGSGVRFLPVAHTGHDSDSPEEASEIADLVRELLEQGGEWIDADGENHTIGLQDVLLVTPYNAQARAIGDALPGARIGTVDKFQGQEAPLSIYSMATSSAEDAPRGMEFLYSLHRLNVATSRARCVAVVVCSPQLLRVRCRTPRQMRLANAIARFVELAPQWN